MTDDMNNVLTFPALTAADVECRVQQCTQKGATLLLYKNARCDMRILDKAVGALNWQRTHSRDNANCTVSIWDSSKRQWISKEDTGTESNTEAEKGLCSDSFKRACINWGIGRELYTSPFIWVPAEKLEMEDTGKTDKSGKRIMRCMSRFSVSRLEVEDGRITGLTISTRGTPVFDWGNHSTAQKPTQKASTNADATMCACCGKPILPYRYTDKTGKTREMSAEQLAARNEKKYGRRLCFNCAVKIAEQNTNKGGNENA